jgi:hypothetical protein
MKASIKKVNKLRIRLFLQKERRKFLLKNPLNNLILVIIQNDIVLKKFLLKFNIKNVFRIRNTC